MGTKSFSFLLSLLLHLGSVFFLSIYWKPFSLTSVQNGQQTEIPIELFEVANSKPMNSLSKKEKDKNVKTLKKLKRIKVQEKTSKKRIKKSVSKRKEIKFSNREASKGTKPVKKNVEEKISNFRNRKHSLIKKLPLKEETLKREIPNKIANSFQENRIVKDKHKEKDRRKERKTEPKKKEKNDKEEISNKIKKLKASGKNSTQALKKSSNSIPTIKKKDFNKEAYISCVIQEIEKKKFYPLIARRFGMEGKVFVKFLVNREGKVLKTEILKSSGKEILDKAALKLIKKCSFPPLPQSFKGEYLEIKVAVNYSLEQ